MGVCLFVSVCLCVSFPVCVCLCLFVCVMGVSVCVRVCESENLYVLAKT